MSLPAYAEDERFEDAALSDTDLEGAEFEGCRFERCRFDSVRFRRCRFEDCDFVDCDFVTCKWPESGLREVRFEGGRLMGIDWTGVRPFGLDLRFTGCRMDHSVFYALPLAGARFERCRLREVDFSHADLTRAVFADSDLGGASLRHANLTGADLSAARGAQVEPETCTLKNTRVAVDAVLPVLAALGLDCPELKALAGVE